ncbi:DUF2971 domain-containing protein [Dendrosporobacter sp. 1207_IL3150]|uniref:DUF2971 domain-containing protein n=1 Tax=Dendrosporobacter sp. 1207_IL3150 TaxID=3084054 RepID=UPI002FDB0256
MYRFRSIEHLIGKYQELEKQQIYFAALDELNDPMEGTRRYFWKGDKIIWINLLKHYLLCLEHAVLISRLLDDNKTISKKDIPIYKSIENLPTEIYKERILKIYNQFFADSFVQAYIQFITENPNKIYTEEIYVHLKILSGIALNSIFKIDIESGYLPSGEKEHLKVMRQRNIDSTFPNVWKDMDESQYIQYMELLHDVLKTWDSKLLQEVKDSPKIQSIYIEFPQMYLDSIVELTYPKAYVACFMDNCLNSSIWGTYGANHTGVCLKFKTDENIPLLKLKAITGYSSQGNIYKYKDFSLQQIEYCANFEELDFFRNLGRLPIQQLREQWYQNDDSELSICAEKVFLHEAEWRSQYWSNYNGAYLKKLPAWSHEREYRIILSSVLDSYEDPKDRLLEYRFEDLEAIIFGMKTPKEARIKIIDIIQRKCKEFGRNQFDFYEMAYSNSKNELYYRKLLSTN